MCSQKLWKSLFGHSARRKKEVSRRRGSGPTMRHPGELHPTPARRALSRYFRGPCPRLRATPGSNAPASSARRSTRRETSALFSQTNRRGRTPSLLRFADPSLHRRLFAGWDDDFTATPQKRALAPACPCLPSAEQRRKSGGVLPPARRPGHLVRSECSR